jgi:hypothetical protein
MKVAFALYTLSLSRRSDVYVYGPSSKVKATSDATIVS